MNSIVSASAGETVVGIFSLSSSAPYLGIDILRSDSVDKFLTFNHSIEHRISL